MRSGVTWLKCCVSGVYPDTDLGFGFSTGFRLWVSRRIEGLG